MRIIRIIGLIFFSGIFLKASCNHEEGKIEPQKVLIDSLQLSNRESLYWYKYETITNHSGLDLIAITGNPCSVSDSNTFFRGNLILDVSKGVGDTIFITSFQPIEKLKDGKYIFINKTSKYGEDYKKKSLNKEIAFSQFCR